MKIDYDAAEMEHEVGEGVKSTSSSSRVKKIKKMKVPVVPETVKTEPALKTIPAENIKAKEEMEGKNMCLYFLFVLYVFFPADTLKQTVLLL